LELSKVSFKNKLNSFSPFHTLLEVKDRDEEITDPNDLGGLLTESDLNELLHHPDLYNLTPSEIANVELKYNYIRGIEKEYPLSPEERDEQREYDRLHNPYASKTAADVSDQVPPMSLTTDESKSATPQGGQPLPPRQTLNNAPGDVLYDSKQEEKGDGKFQVTTDPTEKTVTVKFLDEVKEKALDNALNQGVGQKPSPQPMTPQGQNETVPFEEINSGVQY